jgi:hypothetical protein
MGACGARLGEDCLDRVRPEQGILATGVQQLRLPQHAPNPYKALPLPLSMIPCKHHRCAPDMSVYTLVCLRTGRSS